MEATPGRAGYSNESLGGAAINDVSGQPARPLCKCHGEPKTAHGRCRIKARERARRWRENNPEKARERERRWRENNPEKERERARRWYENNPEKARERARRWYENNPEKGREHARRWRENNPEKARERLARRVRVGGVYLGNAGFTDREREKLLEVANGTAD